MGARSQNPFLLHHSCFDRESETDWSVIMNEARAMKYNCQVREYVVRLFAYYGPLSLFRVGKETPTFLRRRRGRYDDE